MKPFEIPSGNENFIAPLEKFLFAGTCLLFSESPLLVQGNFILISGVNFSKKFCRILIRLTGEHFISIKYFWKVF
jgi:hypothetical protein